MGNYLPSTSSQVKEMLEAIGLNQLEDLYSHVPNNLILKDSLNIPNGKSEVEVDRMMSALANKNQVFSVMFRGAGAYCHYIPSIVSSVVSKETFITAYTPYQAEISQGILQSIFEYQTMICELTGMDASNASVYDGANAAAEAISMCRDRKRNKALVSSAAHPDVIETIKTYCWSLNIELELIPATEGRTDLSALETMVDDKTACIYIAQPNYYGMIEDTVKAGEIAHSKGAKYIMGINPIAAALLKSPGECGADVAVGEGQPLGMSLSYGGPYLGFMAATSAMARKLPGRIAGQTVDSKGRTAYVLTLQAREQHIRREKASSNICSNQALCAMTAAVYMSAMGAEGIKETAVQCTSKAHYLAQELQKLGFHLQYKGDCFHEFVTDCPIDCNQLMSHLEANGVLGGLPIEQGILWCTTEMNTIDDIHKLVQLIKEVRD